MLLGRRWYENSSELFDDRCIGKKKLIYVQSVFTNLSLVHTNAFSSENAYISVRLGLLSTPVRWVFSMKTHRFENTLESGSKWKRIHILLVWMVENGRRRSSKWKRWPKISLARVFEACVYSSTCVTTRNSIVFERSSVDSRKRIKSVVWTRIDHAFTKTTKTHTLRTD